MKIIQIICALGAALGVAHGADQSSKMETEGIKAFIRKRMQENEKWGWFKSKTKPSAGNRALRAENWSYALFGARQGTREGTSQ